MDVTASHNSAARLRELASRFQEAWNDHRNDPQVVDIGAFLPPADDSLRMPALLMLIPLDLAEAWRNGVPISLEDYLQRFPELGPLDRVPPSLIADEYRIRAQFGLVSPHSVLKMRFPKQFDEVEKLIQSDPGHLAQTIAPKPAAPQQFDQYLTANLVVGDHYQLNRLLGRGGFGEVWHATDLRGGIDKAIKILTRSADSEEAQKEFESLNIVKKINHPCLLRTESYFVENDRLFIVLELADATLRDVLKTSQSESRTGIRAQSLLTYVKHAAEGLDFLHKQGILHRDIKPENILVCGDYGKVADFGLAKTAMNKHSTRADFAGTVVYSAPETWDGRVTTRSDQYSLAATYFELRTGRVLFSGKTFQEVFLKHMQAHPDLAPLPDMEQDVLRRALSKKPEERFDTCAAFVKALEDAVISSGSKDIASSPTRPGAPETRKNEANTTAEGDAAVSRAGQVAADLGAQKKWNETPVRRPKSKPRSVVPIVVGALLLVVAGIGAFVAFERSRQPDEVVDVGLKGAPPIVDPPRENPPKVDEPKKDKIDDPKVVDPKVVEPLPKPPDPKPVEVAKVEPVKPKPPVEDPPSAARKKLIEAQKLFDAKKYAESQAALADVDVAKEADVRRDGLALYAKLLRAGTFTRPQLRSLNRVIADDEAIKPAFAEAMAVRLAEDVNFWPSTTERDDQKGRRQLWLDRLADCDRADLSNPIVQAIKAEAILETGGDRIAEALRPLPEIKNPFLTYVRARIAASQSQQSQAAELIAGLADDELKAITGARALMAASMLQMAAAKFTPERDGRLKIFSDVADADRAYAWRQLAQKLLGDPAADQDWQDQLNAALAAACKSEPDFTACKAIGANLMKDADFAKSKAAIELVLADPAGFVKEMAALLPVLTTDDLGPMIRLGAEQLKKSPANTALRARQAKLWYAKARVLDRAAKVDPDKVLEADEAALALEPEDRNYLMAVARDKAQIALAQANREADPAAKVKAAEAGLAESAVAFRGGGGELWNDLGRIRALLCYTVGRNTDWKSPASKDAIANAIAVARQALASASPPVKDEIEFVLGDIYEGLTQMSPVAVDKNFEEAARAYEQAALRQPRYAFQHGRCLYHWATNDDLKLDKKKRNELLDAAIADFKKLAGLPNATNAAEANYWEGMTYWDRSSRLTRSPAAQKAYERSLIAAAKGDAADREWAKYALPAMVEMTRIQFKDNSETSSDWLAAVYPAWQTLSKDATLANDPGFAAASKSYRDLFAEASVAASARALKANSHPKYKIYLDRSVDANHSTRHANYAVDRALGLKRHAAAIGLTPDELAAIHQQTVTAIDAANPVVGQMLRKELDAGWGQ